ncbi:MAG: PstS family phosphate ABC transporter substrate-binding protein [Clostridiales bacterium]|nr:PstS family phosphate ABC transporter substrate-binding protein [Clostridiales bacterium]
MRARKTTSGLLMIISAAVLVSSAIPISSARPAEKGLEGSLSISGAWALYPMVLRWAEEFKKLYPRVRIDVQAGGAGKGIADVLAGIVDLGMVSRNIHPAEVGKGALAIAVCKDAVVLTVSEKNPFRRQVLEKGVAKEMCIMIWITEEATTWGHLLGNAEKAPLHVYTRSDACGAAETWAAFLGKRQEDLKGIGVYGDPGLAEAVRRDPLGIGFNNINYAYDAKTKKPVLGLAILPIDLDGNRKIDEEENFYQNRDAITQAIARGAYPSPPARDLYLVTKGRPERPVMIKFLTWILGEGQRYVSDTGYIKLSPEKLAEELRKIGLR